MQAFGELMEADMENYFEILKARIAQEQPNYGDGESVLTLLYEAYSEVNRMDDDQIKENFNALYLAMNGMSLKDMDRIIYPVCMLCRAHERSGFVEGIKVGIRLEEELTV